MKLLLTFFFYLKHELELAFGNSIDHDLVECLVEFDGLGRANIDDLELQIYR